MVALVAGRRGPSPETARSLATVSLAVKGMHCSSCSSAVENALRYEAFVDPIYLLRPICASLSKTSNGYQI